jgi:hypothetical protein
MTDDVGDRAELDHLQTEVAGLRREVQYGREALSLVRELRDRTVKNVDDIERLVDLIRGQMSEMGESDG